MTMRFPSCFRHVARLGASLLPSWEACLIGFAVIIFLVPVWAFPYIPTQDGPAHLANSLIFKDYGQPENRFQEFYWISLQPIPNWTCFALLAGFAYLFPPLVAEKLLVSLYLLGFAFSYRYFLRSLGQSSVWVALAGFLLAFNRCFWMGFYNYVLSLPLYFLILGYLLRRRTDFHVRHAAILGVLFLLIFFTHLFGFILAAGSCLWIAITVPPRRLRTFCVLFVALLPACVLALKFFAEAGYASPGGFGQLEAYLRGWVEGGQQWSNLSRDVSRLNRELFGIGLDGPIHMGVGLALLYGSFLLAGFWRPETEDKPQEQRSKRLSLFGLGVAITFLYFLLPDVLSYEKGGFWKARLVLLPPLLWLSCARATSIKAVRYTLLAATMVLLSYNLGGITSYFQEANRDLAAFTAGMEAVGRDRALFVSIRMKNSQPVKPLWHAGNYYCLDSRNVNLSPHFATLPYSLVRLRSGIEEGRGAFESYPNRSLVEVIILWDEVNATPATPQGFEVVFRRGRLTILRKGES